MQIFFSLFSLTSVVEIIASISYSLFFTSDFLSSHTWLCLCASETNLQPLNLDLTLIADLFSELIYLAFSSP
jgi:hypothetical protein